MATANKKASKGKMLAAAGLAAAVAAGKYLFGTKEGAAHRKKIMNLASKAKSEIQALERELKASVKQTKKRSR